MTMIRYYNIKLDPVEVSASAVGSHGYIHLFSKVKEDIDQAFANKDIHSYSTPLSGEMHFSFLKIRINKRPVFIFGKFIKYDRPESIVDLHSGEPLQRVMQNGSGHRYEFRFAFDPIDHTIAVEENRNKLPRGRSLIDALSSLLAHRSKTEFPKHALSIEELSEKSKLNKVFEDAESYQYAKVRISRSNSDDYIEAMADEIDRENKEKGIDKIKYEESAARGSFISNLSRRCKALLRIALKNGDASIRYKPRNKKSHVVFQMSDHPVRDRINETEEEQAHLNRFGEKLIDNIRRVNADINK